MDTFKLLFCICLGIGLSASCGFRVFVPLLVTNVAAMFGKIELAKNMMWLGGWEAFICLAIATVAEVAAYYIPLIDNLLDTIAMPTAMIAGTILSASVLTGADPLLQWGLGIIVGGGSAGVMQAGTGLLRLSSTVGTGGTANPVIATGEHILAFLGALLSVVIPWLMALLFLIVLFWVGKGVYRGWFAKKEKE